MAVKFQGAATQGRPGHPVTPVAFIVALTLSLSRMAMAHEALLAKGYLAGQSINSTVDNPAVEFLLQTEARQDTAHAEVAEALRQADAAPLDSAALAALADDVSIDFATLYFVERLYRDSRNRSWQDAFHARVEEITQRDMGHPVPTDVSRYLIVFVPGYGYKMDTTTGGDFARQRALMSGLGYRTKLLEIDEVGLVEENAEYIADALRQLGQEGEEVILVSASKGGPEVALALGGVLSENEARHVRAWLSVGGVLRGSPFADHLRQWPRSWLVGMLRGLLGHRRGIVQNLGTEARTAAFEELRMPQHLLTLQLVGAPLRDQVERSNRGRYRALRHLGPNDGLTLLADELLPGGIAITQVGLDHFFRDPAIDIKTLALAELVIAELDGVESQNCSSDQGAR